MKKRFALAIYMRYWRSWRGVSLVTLGLALALMLLAPDAMHAYRELLWLVAGLGALTLVLGFAMGHLAFVSIGSDAIIVQLPLWRMRLALDCIYATRLVTLEGAAPGIWKDHELSVMPAVLLDLHVWPQPQRVARFWLGRLVQSNTLLLPVEDTMGMRRALDAAALEQAEARRQRSGARS
ncbi:MAG: hypothetical protein HZB53_01300 [Chloroflexi bacterium]|nr:hypothetical protein [Chloroflexota bacterium]